MKLIVAVLVTAFALFMAFELSSGLKCYQCNSAHQQDCADYFQNETHVSTECPNNETMCRKIVQEAYYDGVWNVRYIRQCASTGEVGAYEGRQCMERTGTYRVKMRYCHCNNQDGCNPADTVKASKLIAFILPLISMLFWSWLKL